MNDPDTPRYCIGDAAKKLLYEKAHYVAPPDKRCGTCKHYSPDGETLNRGNGWCMHPSLLVVTEYGAERPFVDSCGICDNYELVEPVVIGDGVLSVAFF